MKLYFFYSFLFFIGINSASSQEIATQAFNFKAVYSYSYVPDSTKDVKRQENMVLMISNDNKSLYQSLNGYLSDSVYLENYKIHGSAINAGSMAFATTTATRYPSRIKSIIYKKIPINVKVIEPLGLQKYWYDDIPQIQWQILDVTDTINGISCQKATAHHLGREWTAWFANSIPISDGPDRFYGLPGLIMELEDSQHFFHWKLLGISQKDFKVEKRVEKLIPGTRKDVLTRRLEGNNNPNPLALFGKTVNSGAANPQVDKTRVIENNLVDRQK